MTGSTPGGCACGVDTPCGAAAAAHLQVVAGAGFTPTWVGSIRYARNLEALAELWIHLGVPGIGSSDKWGRDFHFQVGESTAGQPTLTQARSGLRVKSCFATMTRMQVIRK